MTAARHLSAALVPASWGCIGWLRRFGMPQPDWPLVAKFHGDYPSIAIENTDADTELKQQDERMRHVLAETGQHFGRVFVGYSGRDTAVMDAVTSVLR